jgi:hypothetical protein
MSKKTRCKECGHRRGPRSTAPMAQAADKPYVHGEQPKKATCGCDVCGGTTVQRKCKIICENCGYTRDCGDA